jgi:hypothetical protein
MTEVVMKQLSAALIGAALFWGALATATTPAFALGGCGPNAHRNAWGNCVFGGQNQDWCVRKTGHPATRMPNGTVRCFR